MTYNNLIDFLPRGGGGVGWPNREHHRERKRINWIYSVGIGHYFLFHLTSLLCLLCRHGRIFMDEGIVVPAWLWTLVERNDDRDHNLKVDNLVYEVKEMCSAMIGDRVHLKSWKLYLIDTKVFVDSVDKYATNMNGCAMEPREIRECDVPCRTPDDANAFTCVMVGSADILKDARCKDLSHIRTDMKAFDLFVIIDALMYRVVATITC
jgi:hypothetical protein